MVLFMDFIMVFERMKDKVKDELVLVLEGIWTLKTGGKLGILFFALI